MRSLQLLSTALCASSVQAFYPYQPPWLEELQAKGALSSRTLDVVPGTGPDSSTSTFRVAARAAREALRLAKKYNGEGHELTRRQNNYDIMEAEETGEESTAGIDQDGTDYSYFVKVALGSKGKEFHMLLDTGAGSSWVMGSACTSKACKLHNTFDPSDSETFATEDETFEVGYGSGKVKGNLAIDTLTVGGMSISYEFGLAKETSEHFVHFPFDGILGMSMNNGSSQNFMEELKEAGEIDSSVFAVSLHRAADGTNDGEIKFGSPNKDRYKGAISYTNTASENNDWAITLDDAAYDGTSSGVGNVLAYIDTGTTYIFGPEDLVESFHRVIPGAKSSDRMSYRVPCDSDKALTFTFSGVDYEVSPKDWISPKNDKGECTSNIYGQEVVKGAWLLGAAFIKNVYTVFDKEQKRIGFAAHNEEASEDQASSKTSIPPSIKTTVAVSTSGSVLVTMTATVTSKPSLGLGGQEQTTPMETSSDSEESSAATASAGSQGSEDNEGDSGNESPNNVASFNLAISVCIASALALLI